MIDVIGCPQRGFGSPVGAVVVNHENMKWLDRSLFEERLDGRANEFRLIASRNYYGDRTTDGIQWPFWRPQTPNLPESAVRGQQVYPDCETECSGEEA
jgi:hypothetical protein